MQINPGPKGILPWSDSKKEEGRNLAVSLSPIEVYACLMIERIKRYEKVLTEIANGPMADYRETALAAISLQPVT